MNYYVTEAKKKKKKWEKERAGQRWNGKLVCQKLWSRGWQQIENSDKPSTENHDKFPKSAYENFPLGVLNFN